MTNRIKLKIRDKANVLNGYIRQYEQTIKIAKFDYSETLSVINGENADKRNYVYTKNNINPNFSKDIVKSFSNKIKLLNDVHAKLYLLKDLILPLFNEFADICNNILTESYDLSKIGILSIFKEHTNKVESILSPNQIDDLIGATYTVSNSENFALELEIKGYFNLLSFEWNVKSLIHDYETYRYKLKFMEDSINTLNCMN